MLLNKSIESISDYPVWFPMDIGNHRGDRLSGRIVEVGMGLHHKYRGRAVALRFPLTTTLDTRE
jgi:hypothetical protein